MSVKQTSRYNWHAGGRPLLQLCPPAAHYYPFASRTGRAVTSSRVVPVIDPSSSSGKITRVSTSNLNSWLEAKDRYPLSDLAVLMVAVPSPLCVGVYATQNIQPSCGCLRTTSETSQLRPTYTLFKLNGEPDGSRFCGCLCSKQPGVFFVSFGNLTGFPLNVDQTEFARNTLPAELWSTSW